MSKIFKDKRVSVVVASTHKNTIGLLNGKNIIILGELEDGKVYFGSKLGEYISVDSPTDVIKYLLDFFSSARSERRTPKELSEAKEVCKSAIVLEAK